MTYYKIDKESINSITSALDLFQIPPTNVSVSSAKVFEILTSNPLNDPPYHFKIHSSDNYIDPTKIFLFSEFRIIKIIEGVETVLGDADKVAPIQLLGNTFIKDLRVRIQGQDVFNSNSLMAYKSYLTHELSYSTEAKKSHLTAAGYTNDELDPSLEAGPGFEARIARYSKSKKVQLMSKLDADIFNQQLYLISHLGMDITITPNDGNFLLISQTPGVQYKLELLDLRLYVKKVSLLDGLALDITRKLDTSKPVRYPIRKSMMKSMFISAGRFEFSANLFEEQIPRRIILGLVKNSNYVGDVTKSPFNFQHYNVREISIIANGRVYPQTPFVLDYDNGRYVRAFHDTQEAIGLVNTSGGNGISYERFGKTHCIYVFNLTNSGDDQGGVFDLLRNGSTAVSIKFSKAVENSGIMLVAFAEVDSIVMIDKYRHVTTDTTI
jgi:hypothetical protein